MKKRWSQRAVLAAVWMALLPAAGVAGERSPLGEALVGELRTTAMIEAVDAGQRLVWMEGERYRLSYGARILVTPDGQLGGPEALEPGMLVEMLGVPPGPSGQDGELRALRVLPQ